MTIIVAILIFNAVIAIHEAGHLLGAKATGIPVTTFSVGMGRRLFGIEVNGTDYRFSLIPIGGYVKFDLPDDEGGSMYGHTSWWRMTTIMWGGIAANIVSAFMAMVAVMMYNGRGFFEAIGAVVEFFVYFVGTTIGGLGGGVADTARLDGNSGAFSGPVGIVDSGTQMITDPARALAFFVIISLAVAVTNALPLPLLDGGQWVTNSIEYARGKPISEKVRIRFSYASLAFLVLLFFAGTANDIIRIINR